MFDSRQPYLDALGLTLWQPRGDVPASGRAAAARGRADAESRSVPASSRSVVESPVAGVDRELSALDWAELAAHLEQQDHRGAARPVFGVGAPDADLLVVGEAPGAEEDRLGEPFVGRAGKLLDRMLHAIGRQRESNTYITNVCKFRPPGNRDPNPEEVAADRPYLERQIELLAPRLIMAVGRVAAHNLLHTSSKLGEMRGQMHAYPGRDIPVLVTYHPAYLLRSPQHKAHAWADLKQALACLEPSQ